MAFPWPELILFMVAVLPLFLYGLTASGHFPAEFRAEQFRNGSGAVIMWGTVVAALFAGAMTLVLAWATLPWYAIVIGGGLVLLLAPLLLQSLPDSFVNGRAGLITFSVAAAMTAIAMWITV